MLQYVYKAEEFGMDEWPAGDVLSLDTDYIPETQDPAEADIFVVPPALNNFMDPGDLAMLPYMAGKADRHVFLDVSEHFPPTAGWPCIFIRCALTSVCLEKAPNSIAWPWPVDDWWVGRPSRAIDFKYDLSFHGWMSRETRIRAVNAFRDYELCDIAAYPEFTGYLLNPKHPLYNKEEGERRKREYRRSMHESRIALCPESIPGVVPYRFYEAMSAGRVPLLVGSHYVLPAADKIPYDDFILRCPAEAPESAPHIVREYLQKTSDEQVEYAGRLARFYWAPWMIRVNWPKSMAMAVKDQLSKRT